MTGSRHDTGSALDTYWSTQPAPKRLGVHVGHGIGRMLARWWSVEAAGTENVPRHGPVILASNHMAYADGPLLMGVSPRPLHTLVKREIFHGPQRWLLNAIGQISVDRHQVDPRAVKRALAVLAGGRALAIYPEGKRGRGDFAQLRGGAAYLALCTGAPVVPVACLGTRAPSGSIDALPARGQRVSISFGPPVWFDRVGWPRTREAVGEATERLGAALRAQLAAALDATGIELPSDPEADGARETPNIRVEQAIDDEPGTAEGLAAGG